MTDLVSEIFTERVLLRNGIATVILVVVVVLLRRAVLGYVRRAPWASDDFRLRWIVKVRWASVLTLTLGLVFVWGTELRTLAFSVVAIAVAVVIATKELILCVSGAVVRATSRSFTIGDRIHVSGIHGDVVDIGLLTTTVIEIGAGQRRTGRSVTFPNGLLLSAPVNNETFTSEFVFHTLTIPLETKDGWEEAEKRLLAAAYEVCSPYLEEARKRLDASARQHGLPSFVIEPRVHLQLPGPGKLDLVLRIPTRARDKGQTEQRILRQYLRVPVGETRAEADARASDGPG